MTDTLEKRLPVAIMSEMDVLREAADALQEHERLRMAMRASDDRLRLLCRQYDAASGSRGFAPYHLTQACKARGLL